MKFHLLIALPALAMTLSWPAHAETGEQQLEYQSVFESYQTRAEPELKNWPMANQQVREIGGWRTYAREPFETSPAQTGHENTTPGTPANTPGHHQHGGEK